MPDSPAAPDPDWDGVMKAKARAPKERAPVIMTAYLKPESVRELIGNALQILAAHMSRRLGFLAALAALSAWPGSVNFMRGEGLRDNSPTPPVNEAERERACAKRAARNLRRLAKWNGAR